MASNLEAFVESQLELGAGFTGIFGVAASRNERNTHRVDGPALANSSSNCFRLVVSQARLVMRAVLLLQEKSWCSAATALGRRLWLVSP